MKKARGSVNLLAVSIVLVIGVLIAMAVPAAKVFTEKPQVQMDEERIYESSDMLDPDPFPVTELTDSSKKIESAFPKENHLRLIGRLAEGIAKHKIEKGGWWECGKLIEEEEKIKEKALIYAYTIIHSAYEVSDHDEDPEFILNPWGLAGTIGNESQFDRCALGLFPRKVAYKKGLLKPRKLTVSHTEEEVLAVVKSKSMQEYFKKSGFDLGTAQLLSRFYPDPNDFEKMLSVNGGTLEAAYQMRYRARYNNTDRPWLYWRGGRVKWYDEKVTRWAKRVGAQPGEI